MNFIRIKKLSTAIFVSLICFIVNPSFAAEKASDISDNHTLSMVLPINHGASPRISLSFKKPNHFTFDRNTLESFMRGRSAIVEFIPKNESVHSWSQIITVMLLKNVQLSASAITNDFLFPAVARHSKDAKLVSSQSIFKKGYEVSKIAILYTPKTSKQAELLYAEYYSGPFDAVGVQYAIKLTSKTKLNDADIANQVKRLESVIRNHTKVINP